jgi:hypothetical protein
MVCLVRFPVTSLLSSSSESSGRGSRRAAFVDRSDLLRQRNPLQQQSIDPLGEALFIISTRWSSHTQHRRLRAHGRGVHPPGRVILGPPRCALKVNGQPFGWTGRFSGDTLTGTFSTWNLCTGDGPLLATFAAHPA